MVTETNPFHYATVEQGGGAVAPDQIKDSQDYPHTGLIKALQLGMQGNFAIKGATNEFDITQSATDPVLSVSAGKIFQDNLLTSVNSNTFDAADFNNTANNYHLLVAEKTGVGSAQLAIRKFSSSTTNRVPETNARDAIIAVIRYTSDGFGSMEIQYLTTDKIQNHLSISQGGSGDSVYTEAARMVGGTATVDFVTQGNRNLAISPDGTGELRLNDLVFPNSDGTAGQFLKTDGSNQLSFATVDTSSLIAHTDIPDSDTGFVKRTGVETYDIDTNTYLTAESDTLDTVTGRGATTVNDIVVGDATVNTITSSVNQNISYEVVDASNPTISGGKTVVYVHDISSFGNTLQLPPPASGNILYIQNFFTNTITIVGNPLINENDTTHPKITAPNTITLEPFEHVTLQAVTDSVAPLVTGHYIISDGDKDRSANYATAAQGVKADSALQTNSLVRYGLTADETLSSASRYTFTSADFTEYAGDANAVTFSGTSITLKGAGIFEVNLYGYFAADTANSNLEFDLSIGDGTQSNRYAYYRNIINLNSVVRMSQFTTATIKTTADTVINLSCYIVWTGGNRKLVNTGANDPYSTATPQYTGFTIRKVA